MHLQNESTYVTLFSLQFCKYSFYDYSIKKVHVRLIDDYSRVELIPRPVVFLHAQ